MVLVLEMTLAVAVKVMLDKSYKLHLQLLVCRIEAALICKCQSPVPCQTSPRQMETQASTHRTYASFLKNRMIPFMAMM